MNAERESLWPAAARVWREPAVRWALRAAGLGGLLYARGWIETRASSRDVDVVQGQIATPEQRARIPLESTLAARQTTDELARLQDDDRDKAQDALILQLRLDLIRFQAASAEPRADMRAATGETAVRTYLELRGQLGDDAAYRRALETRPPRPRPVR